MQSRVMKKQFKGEQIDFERNKEKDGLAGSYWDQSFKYLRKTCARTGGKPSQTLKASHIPSSPLRTLSLLCIISKRQSHSFFKQSPRWVISN